MQLSIVIPTLDEEENLGRFLPPALAAADEVVVSDGGSSDRTRELAADLGARVIVGAPEGRPSRGLQLNEGARAAKGEVLLFLHADTCLPEEATRMIRESLAAGNIGGGFHARYVGGSKWLEGLGNRLVRARTSVTGCPLGDQAQFVTRTAFEAVGGFPDWPILEDLELIRRLRRHGPTAVIDRPVSTSARRFEQRGLLRTVGTNWLIWGLYSVGVSPQRLATLYYPQQKKGASDAAPATAEAGAPVTPREDAPA